MLEAPEAETSSIEWTDATWQPITGCAIVSPGCTNCYAMKLAGTRLRNLPSRVGLTVETKAGPVWNGKVRLNEEWLLQPLTWRRPRKIFVCAHGDLFAAGVPDAWIDCVVAVMALAGHHTFQVLTKRPARMRTYFAALPKRIRTLDCDSGLDLVTLPLRNVWLGVSAEDQRRADERVPDLLATPAAVRFVSAEPLLGPIDFTCMPVETPHAGTVRRNALRGWLYDEDPHDGSAHGVTPGYGCLDWIIVGGESGPGARPMHPDWARQIRDACAAAGGGVAFHFKQHGAYVTALDRERDDPDWRADYSVKLNDRRPEIAWLNLNGGRGFHGERFHVMRRVGKAAAGRLLDGVTHNAMPGVARG